MSGSLKIWQQVTNARRVQFMFRAMNDRTRMHLREVVQETGEAVAARARANVPVSTSSSRKAKGRPGPGELRDTIRTAYALNGLSGYVLAGNGKLVRRSKAKRPKKHGPLRLKAFLREQKRAALKALRELGVYAMVVEYGSPGRGTPASHYMTRAKEAEHFPHLQRVRRALLMASQEAVTRAAA